MRSNQAYCLRAVSNSPARNSGTSVEASERRHAVLALEAKATGE